MTMDKRQQNRIKSLGWIGVFIVGVATSIIMTVVVVTKINERNVLNSIKEQLQQEIKDNRENGETDDNCYTVYVKDEYALIDGEIYIYKK